MHILWDDVPLWDPRWCKQSGWLAHYMKNIIIKYKNSVRIIWCSHGRSRGGGAKVGARSPLKNKIKNSLYKGFLLHFLHGGCYFFLIIVGLFPCGWGFHVLMGAFLGHVLRMISCSKRTVCSIIDNKSGHWYWYFLLQYRSASLSINSASRAGACTDCEYIKCTIAIIIIVILVRSLFLVDIMCSFG